MLQGKTPFYSDSYDDMRKNIAECKYSFTPNFSKEAIDLIEKLLAKSKKDRLLCFDTIKAHPFFNEID